MIIREINAPRQAIPQVSPARVSGGATYTVSHYDSFDDDNIIAGPTRSWTFRSDENGEVRLSEGDCLSRARPSTPVLMACRHAPPGITRSPSTNRLPVSSPSTRS